MNVTGISPRFYLARAFLFFTLSASAMASQIFVEGATGGGVEESDLTAATELVKTSVTELGHTLSEDAGKADFMLRPKLVRLGTAYVLTLQKIKGGLVSFSSQLKADRIEELDKVALRLTRSVVSDAKASDDPRVGELTHQEASEGNERRPVHKNTMVGFGGAGFSALNSNGVAVSLGLAHSWTSTAPGF